MGDQDQQGTTPVIMALFFRSKAKTGKAEVA
jgi:hypothetical protein